MNSSNMKPKTTGKVLRFNVSPEREESPPRMQSASRSVVSRTAKATQKLTKYHRKQEYEIYIHRLLKATVEDISISRDAMSILNTFCEDMFTRISKEAAQLVKYNQTSTLGMNEVRSGAKLVVPHELADFAIADANKAMMKYNESKMTGRAPEGEDPMCVCTC